MPCKWLLLAASLLLYDSAIRAESPALAEVKKHILDGSWQLASQIIERELARNDLGFEPRDALLFERERMRRIRVDFSKTRQQIIADARKDMPVCSDEMLARWEKDGALESWRIDGATWYFNRAGGNVWRIHPEARRLRETTKGPFREQRPYVLENLRQIVRQYPQEKAPLSVPKKFQVTYTLSVKPDAVPAGEVIRAWLPWPQDGGRQSEIKLISVDPPRHILSPPGQNLASVYVEKPAIAGQPTVFRMVFEYTSTGFYRPVDPARVQPVDSAQPDLRPFSGEQPSHLVFSDEIRELSRKIVGSEKNPWLVARLIFQWVHENIPWAGAREYSTLDSLPQYALARRHGDCGIQTMLFMTLCRLNGIPARWESGWVTGPEINMHDWCQIYIAPYGWLPVDVSYGMVSDPEERVRWFFLGGCDSFRLVVNRDHSQALFPAKCFFRSEIVDFQRGEVEWRGGNLYFDQWTYDFKARDISVVPTSGANLRNP